MIINYLTLTERVQRAIKKLEMKELGQTIRVTNIVYPQVSNDVIIVSVE